MSNWDFKDFLERLRAWGLETFGPGRWTKGICEHIRAELHEIEAAPLDLMEWVDIINLGLAGAWRAGHSPEAIIAALEEKLAINQARQWPDWRTISEDHPSPRERGNG